MVELYLKMNEKNTFINNMQFIRKKKVYKVGGINSNALL